MAEKSHEKQKVVVVGGTAYPANKLLLVLPWIGLAAIAGATGLFILRRRRVQS